YIENSSIMLKTNAGKVALIKIFHDYFYITKTEVEHVDANNDITKQTKIEKSWHGKFNNNITYHVRNSQLAIADKYYFDSTLINDIIYSPENHNINENIYVYNPKEDDLKEIYEWIKPNFMGAFKLATDNHG